MRPSSDIAKYVLLGSPICLLTTYSIYKWYWGSALLSLFRPSQLVNLRTWIWIAMLGDRLAENAVFPYLRNGWTGHYQIFNTCYLCQINTHSMVTKYGMESYQINYCIIIDNFKMQANVSLHNKCVQLNNSPVIQLSRTASLVTNDDIDPDDNFYNILNVDSVYYTEDEFNDNIVSKLQAASTFSIIHFNARSMSANFNTLKSVLSSIDFTFDLIAVTETWLSDDDLDFFHMDEYDDIHTCRHNRGGSGVALYINRLLQSTPLPLLSKCILCWSYLYWNYNSEWQKHSSAAVYRAPNTDLSVLNDHIEYIFETHVNIKWSTCVAILMWIC